MSETNNLLGLLSPHQRMRAGQRAMAQQYDRPTPHDTLPVQRATLLPLATYENGMTGPALPGLLAQPVESFNNLLKYGYTPGTGDTKAVEDAFDVAGGAFTGSLLAPRPRNALGIFGGRNAKTADHAALARAEAMEAAGKPRDDIWTKTGWFKGVDGKWRWEIDDSASLAMPERMLEAGRQTAIRHDRPDLAARMGERGFGGRSDLGFSHDAFYAAYPDAAGTYLAFLPPDAPRFKRGGGYARGVFDGSGVGVNKELTPTDMRSTLLHEAQHMAQANEGFARGTNPNSAFPLYLDRYNTLGDAAAVFNRVHYMLEPFDTAIDTVARQRNIQPGALRSLLQSYGRVEDILAAQERIKNANGGTVSPYEWYRRHAGEVEARTVQKRSDMTPEQRHSRPPWLDYDVPEADQLVRPR